MKILVTGATGFVGKHLSQALLERGDDVWMLGRNFSDCADLLALGATQVQADLRDAHAIKRACQGMDGVFHVGALSSPWGRKTDFHAINVDGTEHVIAGCQTHHVQRLVFVSSPSVLSNGQDQVLLTDDAPYPKRFISEYSYSKKLAEDRVNAAIAQGLPAVILRPKAIFGLGDTALLPRLVNAARQKRLPQIGDGQNLVDLTHVANVVHAMLLALEAPAALGNTYTITNDEHVRLWDVVRTVLQHHGLSTNLRQIPLSVALVVARLLEIQAIITGREPLLTRYAVTILARTQTHDISATKRDLDYQPILSVAEGIKRTLAN